MHERARAIGDWTITLHGQATLAYTDERGPRGDSGLMTANHVMGGARRRVGAGVFSIQSMWSLEPLMGRRGYPLLGQTGETSDGVAPLIDRQHPHDFPMELAATYARGFGDGRSFYVYGAAVGSPALGPAPFMHRRSGSAIPIAPITHHWFDSTHISFGVLTAGIIPADRVKFEASAFRGREPDQDRWGFETPRLDSFSLRVSVNPNPHWSFQVSAGVLDEPEQLHHGADVARITASAVYARQWRRTELDVTLAWGRNKRTDPFDVIHVDGLEHPPAVSHAALAEGTLRVAARHAFVLRLERAGKDDLVPAGDPRHGALYPVTRVSTGYAVDVARIDSVIFAAGGALSWTRVPGDIRADYGGSQMSVLTFVELRLH